MGTCSRRVLDFTKPIAEKVIGIGKGGVITIETTRTVGHDPGIVIIGIGCAARAIPPWVSPGVGDIDVVTDLDGMGVG